MNIIQACKDTENGCRLIRFRGRDSEGIPQYDVKPWDSGNKKGWQYLDSFTGSAILAIYNALGPELQKRAPRVPLYKLAEFAYKHVNVKGGV